MSKKQDTWETPNSGFWWRPREIVCCIEPWHAQKLVYDYPLEGVIG